jgi:hypothetical protein
MRVKSALGLISIIAAVGLITPSAADAGWCHRRAPVGWCGPQRVTHYVYYPQYRNVYYMATFAPDPYPYVYVPRGYWPRYERPYWRYGRRYWAPRRARYYPVPAPIPVPVGGCCRGEYLK